MLAIGVTLSLYTVESYKFKSGGITTTQESVRRKRFEETGGCGVLEVMVKVNIRTVGSTRLRVIDLPAESDVREFVNFSIPTLCDLGSLTFHCFFY